MGCGIRRQESRILFEREMKTEKLNHFMFLPAELIAPEPMFMCMIRS